MKSIEEETQEDCIRAWRSHPEITPYWAGNHGILFIIELPEAMIKGGDEYYKALDKFCNTLDEVVKARVEYDKAWSVRDKNLDAYYKALYKYDKIENAYIDARDEYKAALLSFAQPKKGTNETMES